MFITDSGIFDLMTNFKKIIKIKQKLVAVPVCC